MEIDLSELINAFGTRKDEARYFPLIGQNVFVRTVTYHYIGNASEVRDGFLKLTTASWVADSGRWSDALKNGSLSEVEPYPENAWISLSSIVDFCIWSHPLPREQK